MSQNVIDIVSFKSKMVHNFRIEYALRAMRKNEGNCLELGCGEGLCLRTVLKHSNSALKGYGIDMDAERINKARQLNDGIDYKIGDITQNLPYSDGTFDAVLILDVLEHVGNPQGALAEAKRVLKPNGILFMVVPCEGSFFTLHWVLSKIKLGHRLTQEYGGHIQHFGKKEIFKLLRDNHFLVEKKYFSCHLFGQLTDILGFLVKDLDKTMKETNLDLLQYKFLYVSRYVMMKLMKTFLFKLSYYESLLFRKIGFFALDVNLTCKSITNGARTTQR